MTIKRMHRPGTEVIKEPGKGRFIDDGEKGRQEPGT